MTFEVRQDPQGGPCYNQFERVRLETGWRNRLQKETECRRAISPSGFQLNLSNCSANGGFLRLRHSHNRMETVTEKELKQSPQARMSLRGMEPDSLPVMAVKHMGRGPGEKWDLPATTSQEAAWLLANPVRSHTLVPDGSLDFGRRSGSLVLPGTMAVMNDPDRQGSTLSKPLSVVTPANERVLQRIRSSPTLPRGPPQAELKQINNPRWSRPKSSCDVSQYAEAYRVLMNHNPFNKSATR
mmetsp:Transcript_8940/g.21024  ORF Transcript_8940/g.21024 Transcript_8940/m.21024 type:complete len:241 (-) Transcript_8940:121-843(-)|eukprot:CAMPEP_0171110704 /NCGR_PEP_ID=MMETSP0766_2-20121228/72202_1 /TAXON_ID=439317 /ORGANISM="Gambierdiscus australes, Strain CAWD 149" /LENGTH=240 /DNA_ID=CAMNT_0011572607 /DNA_START=38 /DNA_END=760 /DNA_ORIENTATION=+